MTEEAERNAEDVTSTADGEEVGGDGVSFPASYVRELRAENARRRTNERKLEGTLSELASALGVEGGSSEAVVERVKEALAGSAENRALAEEALLSSRLTELAVEREVVDCDAARRLLDMSGVTVDLSSREVAGLEEALDALLSARPYLRGRSVPGRTPGGGTPRASRAADDETLAGRVRSEFARRLPSGMSVPGAELGNLKMS